MSKVFVLIHRWFTLFLFCLVLQKKLSSIAVCMYFGRVVGLIGALRPPNSVVVSFTLSRLPCQPDLIHQLMCWTFPVYLGSHRSPGWFRWPLVSFECHFTSQTISCIIQMLNLKSSTFYSIFDLSQDLLSNSFLVVLYCRLGIWGRHTRKLKKIFRMSSSISFVNSKSSICPT